MLQPQQQQHVAFDRRETIGIGPVRIPISPRSGLHPPLGWNLLPAGRVEAVYIVDPSKRFQGRNWRLSFDLEALSTDDLGREIPEQLWKPRVSHVLRVLNSIVVELGNRSLRPVFVGKAHDDGITIALWKSPRNPPVIIEVGGWRVERFDIEAGHQCAMGFDPSLAEITDPRSFGAT
jgi:hypothetical protein